MGPPELKRGLSQAFHEGSQVWVPVVEFISSTTADGSKRKVNHWKQAVVQNIVKQPSGNPLLQAKTYNGQLLELHASDCCLQNERDDTVDDLVKSDFLHEPGILHTLRVRYGLDSIYTYSGNILIAANPHKRVRHLYGARMMAQYKGVPLGELSPHVYAIAEQAYGAMMIDQQRQAILISGESGAGKTESAKMVMQYLAHRAQPSYSQHSTALQRSLSNGHEAPIEEQVLESNPLLEAFGNAKTSRNDNSSRFGKFVEIDFDATGRVAGASISTYLLERSRVVSIKSPERSYHIFYQLCAGADNEQRADLRLAGGAVSFRYLSQSDSFTLEDVDDAEQFRHTLEAMRVIGLSQELIDNVLRLVACVLHLGNITFQNSSSDEAMVGEEHAMQAMEAVAALLGVSEQGLEAALTTRTIATRGEKIVKCLDADAAAESRDALAKTLYARLFDWLVAAINRKIGSLGTVRRTTRTIGILDIYGFESFDENSFEQLCINLANERLQQQFNAHVFKGEQEEYGREGISWSYIDFIDNQDCLDLLEGAAGQLGVFPLIDEACRLPRATHKDLSHTLRTKLAGHPRFGAPRRQPYAFVVDHYAGEVCYASEFMMDKNKDFVVAEHAHLMASSSVVLLRELFDADAAALGGGGSAAADALSSQAGSELPSPKKQPETSTVSQRRSGFMLSSVGARFRKQLQGLMGTLATCQPHYIRCVKPNPESRPGNLIPEYVLEQLRAGGVLEAVRIACAGFPTRKPFMPFAQRYCILLGRKKLVELGLPVTQSGFVDWYTVTDDQLLSVCKHILYGSGLENWQLGKTRVFLRAGQLAQLEGARGRRLTVSAVQIQAVYRGMHARLLLRTARGAAAKIQAAWRGHQARKMVVEMRKHTAATRIQTLFRMHFYRRRFVQQRLTKRATLIQSYVRMHQARRKFLHDTEVGRRAAERAAAEAVRIAAAVTIQKYVRCRIAVKKVAERRAEAEKLRSLQREVEALRAENLSLVASQAGAAQRADRAEDQLAALKAQVASLESELTSTRLELQAVEGTMAQVKAVATASEASQAEVARLAELEAAHRKAAAALEAELELLRKQRAEAEEHGRQQEQKVLELQGSLTSQKEEMAALLVAVKSKDKENESLWKQVKQAAENTQQEFVIRETTIRDLQQQLEQQSKRAEQAQQSLREETRKEVAAVRVELQRQLSEAQALAESRAAAMKDMQDKIQHLSSRVVAVTSHSTRVEDELRAAGGREQALARELEGAKKVAAALERSPSGKARMAAALGTTPSRTLSNQFDLATAEVKLEGTAAPGPAFPEAHAQALSTLVDAAVKTKLGTVQVPLGMAGPLPIPLAAWLLCESFINWAGSWAPAELDTAATRVEDAIVGAATRGGLTAQSYWLGASLALGALLKVRTIGLREGGLLLRLGDALIFFTPLHDTLGDTIADMLPVNIAMLLSDEAKKSARRRPTPSRSSPVKTPPGTEQMASVSQWKSLLGGMSNILEILSGEGVPAPALRAVSWAMLRYIDAELLNALLLRRDCCSVSAAKALLAGLAELMNWVGYMGAEVCGEVSETEKALDRVAQAARYIVQGKEDCMRKAMKGVDITLDLARLCPALSLQQIYKLTEHQHDDWIVAAGTSVGTQNIVLLETLKRLMDEQQARAAGQGLDGLDTGLVPTTPSEEGDDSLLADIQEAFLLPRKLLNDAARCFVQAPAARAAAQGSPAGTITTGGSPFVGQQRGLSSKAPRLPDGTVPHLASGLSGTAAPAAGLALLDMICQTCRGVELPQLLAQHPSFNFLKG